MKKKIIVLVVVISLVLAVGFVPRTVSASAPPTSAKLSQGFTSYELENPNTIKVIVELWDTPVVPYQIANQGQPFLLSSISGRDALSYAEQLMLTQQDVFNEVKKICSDAELIYSYQYTYNGFALMLKGEDVEKLVQIKGIKKIFPVAAYYVERSVATSLIGANDMWEMTDEKGNPVDGTGMLIGIIDTGIDYNHPDLGGGFGPGYKVAGGYDFGDDDTDPMDVQGHGTHVAGIAAGDGEIKGVAPKANLMGYKIVPGGNNSASTEAIIAAVEQAVKDKCNAVNLSFGSGKLGTADPEDPENKAFDNAADSGVLAAISAGNQGARSKSTPYPLGSPAGARKVIAVAASDDAHHPSIFVAAPLTYEKTIMGDYADVSPKFPTVEEYEVVACGFGSKADVYGLDLTGKIALISRGPIGPNALYFRDKVLNAKAAGAAGVILYNNLPGIVSPALVVNPEDADKEFLPTIFITEVDGLYLKSLINKGLKIKFGETDSLGTAADFTSMGPTSDFYFKPEVSAPGVAINSSIPGGKYASWQGTSMAAPFVTGAICLVKQMHPSWNSEQIKSALMNTATLLTNPETGRTITWTLQGAGRINIPAAATTTAIVQPYDLLAKVVNIKPVTFTVQNLSESAETFSISSELTSVLTEGLTVSASKESLTVAAGKTATFSVTFTADQTKLSNGPHEGVIYVESENTKLHVPFVLWNGDVEIPEILTNVSTSTDTITPNVSTMDFNFTLGTGSLIPPPEPKDRATNANIIDEMQVRIFDMDGNLLGLIYNKALLLVGDYTFTWDGRDISGSYFLDEGTYKWEVAAVESNNDVQNPDIDDAAVFDGEFKVVNAPETMATIAVEKDSIVQGDTVATNVNITVSDKLSSVSTVVTFDATKLSIDPDSITEGEFFSGSGETVFDYRLDNFTGELFITISMKEGTAKAGKGTLLSFNMLGKGVGTSKIGFKEALLSGAEGEILSLFIPTVLTVTEAPNPWDLNRDNTVDNKDVELFKKSFGNGTGDPDYNPQADFNGDSVVNGKDLIILAVHFGEIYP